MEKTFTVYEHGIEKFISRSGKMRGDSVAIKLDIPKERRADSTNLTVQVAPSMATTMLMHCHTLLITRMAARNKQ
jgi:hypothetical protein